MEGMIKKARNLLQQEPGQKGRHVDGNDDAANISQVRPARQHHDTADQYAQSIVTLKAAWRGIICKHGVQWILQRRDAKRSGQARWRAVGYFCTKSALIRVSRTSCGAIAPAVQTAPDALPEMIRKGVRNDPA